MVFELDANEIYFPDPSLAEEDGLLAIGGDLSAERLILAYQNGIFPWYSDEDPILWFSPHERCVIYPERLKVSKSLKKVLASKSFNVTADQQFELVIAHCANVQRKDQPGTWITHDMQAAYLSLHKLGWAHSIEVWQGELLVGGLYGIAIGKVFCGESMFSLASNASKIALYSLCKHLKFEMIDCQLPNNHLMSLGAEMIDRETYLTALKNA